MKTATLVVGLMAIGLMAIGLMGCSHRSDVRVRAEGQALSPGAYVLTAGPPGSKAAADLESVMANALQTAGLRPATAGEAPLYVIDAAFTDRPARISAASSGQDAERIGGLAGAPRPSRWTPWRRHARSLVVTVASARDGTGLRRIVAHEYDLSANDAASAGRLAKELATHLQ